MSLLTRLKLLEDAMLGHGDDAGYELVMVAEDEMPQDAVKRSGLMNWPTDRIIFVCFVKADQELS